ncbi:MAG: carbon-nitrogen family hydrolase [Lachnospiraceae bacterium]|nr:carbon-nitrogen family hydrolase [Lachnospiraceae bacterium]
MKVSLAQTHIYWEDVDKNLETAERVLERESGKGSALVLFPEMSFTGFTMNGKVAANDDAIMARMADMARKYGIAAGFGRVKKEKKCQNHYTVVDCEGSVISDYIKIHPFSYAHENVFFESGSKVSVFDIGGLAFSNFICYDLRFPELFQAVADRVSVIAVPANWPGERSAHWDALLKARAIENQVYILGINCAGEIGGKTYAGGTCVIDPAGNVLRRLGEEEETLCFELEDDVASFREAFPVRQDRKVALYGSLYGL